MSDDAERDVPAARYIVVERPDLDRPWRVLDVRALVLVAECASRQYADGVRARLESHHQGEGVRWGEGTPDQWACEATEVLARGSTGHA